MKNPCKNCPFKKCNDWHGGGEGKIMALKEFDRQKIFSCHLLHPTASIFTIRDMEHNDCAGAKMMFENMKQPDKHKDIVNCFNETGPDYDLVYWAQKSSYISELNLL